MSVEYNNALQAQALFTINSLNQIINSNQGVNFSPYSLTLALAMCYIGAGGKTEKEFKKLLSPNMEKTEYLNLLESSVNKFELSFINGTTIHVGNKIFLQNGYKINNKYKEDVNKYLKTSVKNVDFRNPKNSAKIINDYISDVTHNKIKDIINPASIGQSVRAILTNVIYFKSQWQKEFDKKLTSKGIFYTTKSKKKLVKMMKKKEKMLYGSDKNFHAVQIPYTNKNIKFTLVLPKIKNKLHSLLKKLEPKSLLNLIHSTKEENVIFSMPKFKVESSYKLRRPLIKMGLMSAFSNKANFSLMTPENDLTISDVYQKVYVDVNEKGTEAAAATSVIMFARSMPINSRNIFVRANHPFLYFITNNEDILFSGVYQ